MRITERPAGQREDYLFIEDGDQRFKVLHELRQDGARLWLVLSLSPVDQAGKALRIGDQPDIAWHTHQLTETELSAPDFDLDARISTIIAGLVAGKRREMEARSTISALTDRWRAGNLTIKENGNG